MRVYLDNCCYNRPFDEQTQAAVDRGILKKMRTTGSMRIANPAQFVLEGFA